jgi:Ca-activated chloride channel family protein
VTFAQPLWLGVAAVAALAFLAFAGFADRRARATALDYSQLSFIEAVAGRTPWGAILAGLWALVIAACGVALARPAIVASIPVHDASVVLCIDTSGSMASTDVLPTRSQAAQQAALTFIDGVPSGTRIGIVAFSSFAVPLGALTADRATAEDDLSRLPPPNGGTAIGDALTAAAGLLPPAGRRAIVLVTDGVNNHGSDPLDAARTIGAAGITIFTIGIGTNGSGELIPGTGESAELDEDALRGIAAEANGTYARVADADALRTRLSALALTTVRERRHVELAFPLAVASAILAAVTATAGLALGRFP